MKKEVLIWGYLSSFTLLLGAIFLNHSLNAGKVLYLTGFFAFNLGYLIPLFYVIFKENQENKIGLVLIFGILGFITFLTGVSFFVVNWGGGIILIYIGAGILILAILTIIAFSRRFYETSINAWFPVLVFGVFIVGSLLIGMVHRHVMRAFTINNIESVKMYESINLKNTMLTQNIHHFNDLNPPADSVSIKTINELEIQTKGLLNYIENLKIDLIKNVEGDAYKMLEGNTMTNLVPVQSNVEINTVSRFMLKKRVGKAFELKNQLINYKDFIQNEMQVEDVLINELLQTALNTESFKLNKKHFNKSWEYQHFYDLPLITVLSELSCIQMRIAYIQGEILNYYYIKQLELGVELNNVIN
jgi:hypothetical protein